MISVTQVFKLMSSFSYRFALILSVSQEQQYTDYSFSSSHHRLDMFLPKSNSSSHLDEDHLSNCFLLSGMVAIEEWQYESITFGREQSNI